MKKDEMKRIIDGLSDLIMNRYELFLQLIDLEINGIFWNEEYYSIVQKLGVLTTKEDRLISKLSDITSNLADDDLFYESELCFDLEITDDVLLKRLDSILMGTKINTDDELNYALDDYDDDKEYEYDYYDLYAVMAEKKLDLEFLVVLQGMINEASGDKRNELIEFKYRFIFERKKVNDEVEVALYNPANVLDIPLSLEIDNFDEDEYKEVESSVIFDMVLELFNDLLVEKPEDLAGKRDYLIFLLKKLDVIHLQDMEQMTDFCDESNDAENGLCVSDISKIIRKIINDKVLEGNIEYNEICEVLDDATINNIIAVSKVGKLILDIIEGLTDAEDKDEQFKRLRSLMVLEREMLENINADEYNLGRIMDVIENYVPIFIGEFDKKVSRTSSLVINRMKGAIRKIHGLDDGPTTLELEMHSILKNNMLDTLALYFSLINNINDEEERKIYENVYYHTWFMDYSLMDDFLVTQGNVSNFILMDDKFWADFTGVSDIEYGYDKDMKLFEVGIDIIEEIDEMDFDDAYNARYLEFLELKLKKIYENISIEHVMELKDAFNGINSYKRGKCKLLCKSGNKVKKNKTGK